MTTRTPHELAVEALERFIPQENVLKEMRAVYEANKHQCRPGILDDIDMAIAAIDALRAQKPVDVESLMLKPDTSSKIEDARRIGWNQAIDRIATKYNLTEKDDEQKTLDY